MKHQRNELFETIDYKKFVILMNLPELALDFLDAFVNHEYFSSKSNCPIIPFQIYCYCFLKFNLENVETVKSRLLKAFNYDDWDHLCSESKQTGPIQLREFNLRFVRDVAPYKNMYCVEFKLYLHNSTLAMNEQVVGKIKRQKFN